LLALLHAWFPALQPRELQVLQASVDAFLQAATESCPDVAFKTSIPDPDDSVTGGLLVALECYSSSGSSSGRALNSRELQAWQDMVSVAISLRDAGSKRGALGGSDGYDEREGPAMTRLCVTYLDCSLSTQLAISRRRTTSKLLRRSAKVNLPDSCAANGTDLCVVDSLQLHLMGLLVKSGSDQSSMQVTQPVSYVSCVPAMSRALVDLTDHDTLCWGCLVPGLSCRCCLC
jgi:hypothetical protein